MFIDQVTQLHIQLYSKCAFTKYVRLSKSLHRRIISRAQSRSQVSTGPFHHHATTSPGPHSLLIHYVQTIQFYETYIRTIKILINYNLR